MISVNNIYLEFGSRVLFENISLRIAGKDKISLIGINGSGKSTLLKILTGEVSSNKGIISKSKYTTIGYLPQDGVKFQDNVLFDEVVNSVSDIKKIEDNIRHIEMDIFYFEDKESDDYFDLLNELSELQTRYEILEGFKLKSKVEKILEGLGFSQRDFNRRISELSGGWQMRIEIAKLLLNNPSVLLLDEPTNHLDIDSLLWFENYLREYNGAYVIVSHDKSFLDNLTNRTLELSRGKLTEYKGNYSFYRKEKEIRRETLLNEQKNQQKYIKQQTKFIERFRYKATKASSVQSRIKAIEKLDLIELEDEDETINFNFPPALNCGKIVIEINSIYKSYDGITYILEDIDLTINRGDKIAILGVNGAGKTTLSGILADKINYDKGILKYGHNIKIKYYAQNQAEELEKDKSVMETLEESASGEIRQNLRALLGCFLFRGDDVFKKVSVLSGGEKSRLALAKILTEPSNLLILDEPTNHLDMKSKDVLMSALKNYNGTLIVVSHDRDFLDGVVNKVIEVKDKKIKMFYGNCSYYIEKTAKLENIQQINTVKIPKQESDYEIRKRKRKEFIKKLNGLKRKITDTENNIKMLEKKKKDLECEIVKPGFYKDVSKSLYIAEEYEDVCNKLKSYEAEWENLQNELKEIEINNGLN